MSDDKPPGGNPTLKFEPPPKWAEAMFGRVHEGIAATEARLTTRLEETEAKVDRCVSGLGTVANEVERVKKDFYEYKGASEARLDGNSMRAKQESIHNEEQDTKIAELSKSQMAELLKEIAKTPLGQKVANAVGGLLLVLIGIATAWLMAHGAK